MEFSSSVCSWIVIGLLRDAEERPFIDNVGGGLKPVIVSSEATLAAAWRSWTMIGSLLSPSATPAVLSRRMPEPAESATGLKGVLWWLSPSVQRLPVQPTVMRHADS